MCELKDLQQKYSFISNLRTHIILSCKVHSLCISVKLYLLNVGNVGTLGLANVVLLDSF